MTKTSGRHVPALPAATPRRPLRLVYLALGWLFFGLGAVGAILPVLPTTPLMILALACFARASERLHAWLYGHPSFGPPLQRWTAHRVVPIHAKVLSVVAMSASLAYLVWFSTVPGFAIAATALVMTGAAAYILTRPSRAPEPAAITEKPPESGFPGA